jgi:hypothetical protein
MTILVDDLVPEELWTLVEPLLPVPPRPPYGGRRRTVPEAVLHLVGLRHAKGATADWASDHQGQRIERDGHPLVDRLLDGQLVVPSAKVLDERVPGDDDLGAAVLLEPAHRSHPPLETTVVGPDPVVGLPVSPMPRRR